MIKEQYGGVIFEKIKPLEYQFKGLTSVEEKFIFPNGCYAFLPDFEVQTSIYFESNSCVAQSADNALEVLFAEGIASGRISEENISWLRSEGYFTNGKINFNDRALAIASGTNPDAGNSFARVYEAIRSQGVASENIWPWDWRERDAKINNKKNFWNEMLLPVRVKEQMTEFHKRFEVIAEWVELKDWGEAQKQGALQACVYAWHKRGNKYYRPEGKKFNHAVLELQADEPEIFDTYSPAIKQLESSADFYGWALKYNITEKKSMPEKIKIENNVLVFCAEGAGKIGLHLDGRIIIDDVAKVLAVWFLRTPDKEIPKKRTITAQQWSLFEKINLKGEKI
jgi:hypothetical protein